MTLRLGEQDSFHLQGMEINIHSVHILNLNLFLSPSRWMTIFTPAENILVASHKAHGVLVKLYVFQIPRDQSLLVKIGQQWPAM